ncbi:MAG TPA: hypothetical protein VNO50_19820 [Pyrinomonadaceae bacterium]|nr:hypothetical protein [Pyrinomonadaceae bacterium]
MRRTYHADLRFGNADKVGFYQFVEASTYCSLIRSLSREKETLCPRAAVLTKIAVDITKDLGLKE